MASRLLLIFSLCFLVFGIKGACPYGAVASADQQRCFHYIPFKADFLLADQICKQFGGNLSSILSAEDNDLINSLLRIQHVVLDESIWIGGTTIPDFKEWKWTSGKPFTERNIPSMLIGVDCLSAKITDIGMTWEPTKCCTELAFICETATPKEIVCPQTD